MAARGGSRKPSRNHHSGSMSCERIRANLSELHIGAALVHPKPPALYRELEAGAIFGRAALEPGVEAHEEAEEGERLPLPIDGKKPAKEAAARKSTARGQRKSA
jgi:hypothetical protein